MRWGNTASTQCRIRYALPIAKPQRGKPVQQADVDCLGQAVSADRQ
ncbi:hypothetical protein [Cupriavidus necator]